VLRDGIAHQGIDLRFGGENHRIDFKGLVGEPSWLYPQTDVFIDFGRVGPRQRRRASVSAPPRSSAVIALASFSPTPTTPSGRCAAATWSALTGPGRSAGSRFRSRCGRITSAVPVRLVRHPGRGCKRAGAGLHPLAARLSR
jgi:hypothetical protein